MAGVSRAWLDQQTIALAGVAQAARLVDQVSTSGSCPPEFLQASLHSLFTFEADDVEQVFGGLAGVRLGLDTLADLMDNERAAGQREVVRYIFNLLFLERRFSRDSAMMAVVRSRLEHTSFRAEHFTRHSNDICHSVSGIYQDTLSTLKFRIKVNGNVQHLQNPQTADMIRALLLAGIRAAFLWRQLGGRRWKLVLQRRRIGQRAQQLSREAGVV
ncbi:high frequency lysogenization protein HflD [Kineobactrum salinum]|uniref:High frequency lysogenization protein HflD homolog n=1 Tax=Kineobactrum salinum TaxID=2708301 RepID=A0A6C0TX22_9GAMM|nr:high frequency lysogenization protein HflD [Kineobactrum salinum]QIB64073.1 high frequency lysogenization protein HflD [Kineobactrum salinum]